MKLLIRSAVVLFFATLMLSIAAVVLGRIFPTAIPAYFSHPGDTTQIQQVSNSENPADLVALHIDSITVPFPAAQVIARYGVPCRVTIFPVAGRVILAYPQVSFQALPISDRISAASPVDFVTSVDPAFVRSRNLCDVGADLGPSYTQTQWHGFASVLVYANHRHDFGFSR